MLIFSFLFLISDIYDFYFLCLVPFAYSFFYLTNDSDKESSYLLKLMLGHSQPLTETLINIVST